MEESNLVFALNGQRVELKDVDPQTSLLNYIRDETDCKGPKRGCGEGGCGSCVVLLSKYDPGSKQVEEFTINSCLAPVCSIHGCAITTTEGLKQETEPHAVHTRLAGFHATQCGFCTPGMAVSIAASLRKCSRKTQHGGTIGQPTSVETENFISGNLCRCTGYRPILDACKSFAADVDIEDLGVNTFWKSSDEAHSEKSALRPYQPETDPQFPTFLKDYTGKPLHVTSGQLGDEKTWRSASTLPELFEIYQNESIEKKRDVQFVVGYTSSGFYKDFKPSVCIDISRIPELQCLVQTDSALEVGAAVSLSKLIEFLDDSRGPVFPQLADHLRMVASQHVRNRGSVGGNLIMTQKHGFASDVATILLGAGSRVTLASAEDSTVTDLEDFLAGQSPQTSILQSIHIPTWAKSENSSDRVFFRTYRSSPRSSGNAVSSINAAFLAVLQTSTPSGHEEPGSKVLHLRLAFGALGCPLPLRAGKTEKYLTGKVVSVGVLREAVRILREEIASSARDDKLHTAEYRESVGVGYLFQFFKPFITEVNLDNPPSYGSGVDAVSDGGPTHTFGNGNSTVVNGSVEKVPTRDGGPTENGAHRFANGNIAVENGSADKESEVRSFGRSAHKLDRREGFMGKQTFPVSNKFYPVAQPTGKIGAVLQATGEAVFVDDIPLPKGTLHAAFVSSRKALAKITSVNAAKALASPGAASFITVKDIPPNGQNAGKIDYFGGPPDKVFAEDFVGFVGHPLGVMVADTYEHAVQAAAKVEVEYDDTTLGPPILSLEEAAAKSSFKISKFAFLGSASVGDVLEKGDYRIENAEVYAGGQYQFYMEPQTALAVPDEDSCITVYSATQGPEFVQTSLGVALGIPLHNIRVITRRLGGAFGGKTTKSQQVAVACAWAAFKLKRPVRMTLDRNTDMEYCGGRHESKAKYTVEFNKDGKIMSLDTSVLMNGGFENNVMDEMGIFLVQSMKCYNWNSWRHVTKVCRTNLPDRGMMRAPGEIQGKFFAESIIEHVASFLGLDPTKVREVNLHTHESAKKFYGPVAAGPGEHFTPPKVWERLKGSSNFEVRKVSVQEFNQKNMWVKRGISIMSLLYPNMQYRRLGRVTVYGDGSVVVESGGTEMGQGLFTKVQQAAAYGLSRLWGENVDGQVPLSKIRIVQNDTISLGHGSITAGGITSEGTCEAVVNACNTLVDTLRPVLLELQSGTAESVSWEAVVKKAKMKSLPLSAQDQQRKFGSETQYIVCGAAVSEVEVDILTGGVRILQTDLLFDAGKSINPAVDIGQVEGAFVQGIGYYVTEEIKWDENGVLLTNGTWTYKPPTPDNIPHQFNVELLNSAGDPNRFLSAKGAGEPPLLLATSVHNAIRQAIKAARADVHQLQLLTNDGDSKEEKDRATSHFVMHSSATMEPVKKLCGLYNVDQYLEWLSRNKS
ncbi:hypothetical protein R1sor_026953 [Riccia sorocarpa]|uniref:Aldehyde oxidase n=1 Tax=Riccia sorocarpa TaxID=122646 RepID=A0ABD3GG55_9MARC